MLVGANPTRKLLLTGFEAFGGEKINPSAEAVSALSGQSVAGREVITAILPCVFHESLDELLDLLDKIEPELVICVGQAGGLDAIHLERVALNIDDAPIPDNSGAQPCEQSIVDGGPAAYWSTLPLRAIERALATSSIKSTLSLSAGSFVCNHVFYGLMHALQTRPEVRGGFVHVPYLPEQAAAKGEGLTPPSMPLERMVESLRIAAEVSLLGRAEL